LQAALKLIMVSCGYIELSCVIFVQKILVSHFYYLKVNKQNHYNW